LYEYDIPDLADLKPIDSRYFTCRQCGFPNLVSEKELQDILLPPKKEEGKAQIHFECRNDIALKIKKMKANFGSYENMYLHLINSFYKSQPSENHSAIDREPSKIQSKQDSQFTPQISAGASERDDSSDGEGYREVHTSSQGQD